MKFGLAFANTAVNDRDSLRTFVQAAEATGFESLWTVEHVIFPEDYQSEYPYHPSGKMPAGTSTPIPDPVAWLGLVGGMTETIGLATGILILPQRNPVVLAKELATIDHFTGGRLTLGIGVGWLREEFDALGISWPKRGARTDEYIAAMRALWSDDKVSFDGEFASFANVSSNPKPANGTIPIHIGGHSRAACERAGRIGDGFFPGNGDIAEMVDIVRQTAADHGRDPEAIEITFAVPAILKSDDPVGAAQEAKAAGIDRAIVPSIMFMENTADAMAGFSERVIQPIAATAAT